MRRLSWLAMGAALLLSVAAQAEKSRYWDWGVGYYQGIPSENLVDEARFDWAVLSVSNSGITEEWMKDHLNRCLELNPKQRYMVELCPTNHRGEAHRYSSTAQWLDYRYKPGCREAIDGEVRREIRLVLDHISKPENVLGFSLMEELPGLFGAGDQIGWAQDKTKMPAILEEYRKQIEAERGKPLVWDQETRMWVGETFVEELTRIHKIMKEESKGLSVIYWHHGGYTYLDEIGHTVPADTTLDGMGVFPCRFSDIVKDGLVDVLMGWPEHPERWKRALWLAEYLKRPFFAQISHPSVMRLNKWEESLANAKTKSPLNLGYFFYCEGNCNGGAWNDDPSFPADPALNLNLVSRYEHARRFCAQQGVGMDVVARAMVPQVEMNSGLGTAKKGDVPPVTVLLHNPATPDFFTTPEQAVAKGVKVSVELPAGCRLESRYSIPASISVGDLGPMSWKRVEWWVTVDKTPAAGAKVKVTVKSGNRPEVVREFPAQSVIPAFQPHLLWASGKKWAESTIGGQTVTPTVEIEPLADTLKSPAVSDGANTLIYRGSVSPGRKLLIDARGQARMVPGHLYGPTDVGARDADDPNGYKPFTEGYTVAGKWITRPLGEIKKVRVSVTGKVAEEAGSLAIVRFTSAEGKLLDVQALFGALGEEWGTASNDLEVPEGAVALQTIYLYRHGSKGRIWYGTLAVEAADLPAGGLDVTDKLGGTPLNLPVNNYRVITYSDENPPAAQARVRVQLRAKAEE